MNWGNLHRKSLSQYSRLNDFSRRAKYFHEGRRQSKLNLLYEIPSSYFHKIECVSVGKCTLPSEGE